MRKLQQYQIDKTYRAFDHTSWNSSCNV